MRKIKYTACLMLLLVSLLQSQEDAHHIYKGNELYLNGKMPQANAEYAKALEINPGNKKANFNLGNTLYRNALLIKSGELQIPQSEKIPADSLANLVLDQAAQNFAVVANSVSDKDTLHRAWHNIGNCYLQKKDFEQAANAYKKALRFDPADEETRYNLAYALKNMPPKKQGGGGQQQQQQQQQQDKKDQKKQQQQQPEMSKQQAEQLLNALMDSERKLQEKRKQKEDPLQDNPEKDW